MSAVQADRAGLAGPTHLLRPRPPPPAVLAGEGGARPANTASVHYGVTGGVKYLLVLWHLIGLICII